MSVLREILVPAAAVAAAVAIILAIVVLMGRPENPPAPPDPEQPAPDVDAAPLPDAIQRAAALRNRAETRTATLAGSQARPSETATVAAPPTKVDTPRQHEGSPVRSDAAAQAPAPFTTTGASPDERRVSRSGESAGAPKALDRVRQTYVVKGGDTPASIAREHLGDASRWTDIARANPGLDARSLQVGQILNLPTGTAPREAEVQAATMAKRPTAAPGVPAGPSAAPLARHRVAQGDSLYKLAHRYYGDASQWTLIRDANPAMLAGGVAELRLDSELIIPALPKDSR